MKIFTEFNNFYTVLHGEKIFTECLPSVKYWEQRRFMPYLQGVQILEGRELLPGLSAKIKRRGGGSVMTV